MNISNLSVNQRFKSYRQLCDALGIKSTGGKSKIYHLQELERWVKYHREGNAYIIDKIKCEVAPKATKTNNLVYGDKIEDILLYNMNRATENSVFFSVTRALSWVNLVNENYSKCRNNMNKTAKDLNVELESVCDFFTRTHQQFKNAFERALKSMRAKGLIYWNIILVIVKDGVHCEATRDEIEQVLEIEETTLRKLGLKSVREAVATGMWSEFHRMVKEELYRKYRINYYYNAYNLSINRSGVKRAISEKEYQDKKNELNCVTYKRTLINARNRMNKKVKVEGWSIDNKQDTYLSDYEILSAALIRNQL